MEPGKNFLDLPVVTEENPCLPLVVSVVSEYWGQKIPLSEAQERASKYQGFRGSIMIEGIELAEKHGFEARIVNSNLAELKKIIDIGIPTIVILPGIGETIQHAWVVCGYDDSEKTIYHYVPDPEQVGAIPEYQFESQWKEEDNIMIVMSTKDVMEQVKLENDGDNGRSNRLCFDAERLRIQGKTEDAINQLKKSLELNPENAYALCMLGGIYNEQNSAEALSCYEKCIGINPSCYLAYRGIGNYYLKQKDYSNAEEYYSKAIEVNPTRYGPIYKNRGLVRMYQNKNDSAKEDFRSYLKYVPEAPDKSNIEQALNEL